MKKEPIICCEKLRSGNYCNVCGKLLIREKEFKNCQWCKIEFEVGGNSGVRVDRKFCSDDCRNNFNNQKRREDLTNDL